MSLHQARVEAWSPDELTARLAAIVSALVVKEGVISPLDVALDLLGGELEAFVLFGRVGHLDPARADGQVPIAILQCESDVPGIDAAIRETARQWACGAP